jgi:hypothetical protein
MITLKNISAIDKIERLVEEAKTVQEREAQQEVAEKIDWHKYSKSSCEELKLLLSHHLEDSKEYAARGEDTDDMAHITEDVAEIKREIDKRKKAGKCK